MRYLITGASSGIGYRCAERLLQKGNECVLIARNADKMNELVSKFGTNATVVSIDLLNLALIEKLFLKLHYLFPFDGMIHCAGVSPLKRIEENELSTVSETYGINVFSFIELMRCFTQGGVCKDGSSVVSISSVAAHRGTNRQAIYAGTKAALEATSRSMARELLGRNIRVNSIICGAVETEMLKNLRENSENLDDRMKKYYPLGIIQIDEVCELIEYLLSEQSIHITGRSIPVDSGYLL